MAEIIYLFYFFVKEICDAIHLEPWVQSAEALVGTTTAMQGYVKETFTAHAAEHRAHMDFDWLHVSKVFLHWNQNMEIWTRLHVLYWQMRADGQQEQIRSVQVKG